MRWFLTIFLTNYCGLVGTVCNRCEETKDACCPIGSTGLRLGGTTGKGTVCSVSVAPAVWFTLIRPRLWRQNAAAFAFANFLLFVAIHGWYSTPFTITLYTNWRWWAGPCSKHNSKLGGPHLQKNGYIINK